MHDNVDSRRESVKTLGRVPVDLRDGGSARLAAESVTTPRREDQLIVGARCEKPRGSAAEVAQAAGDQHLHRAVAPEIRLVSSSTTTSADGLLPASLTEMYSR